MALFDGARSDLVHIKSSRSTCIWSLGGGVVRVIESVDPLQRCKLSAQKVCF